MIQLSREMIASIVGVVSLVPSMVAISFFVELPIVNGLIGSMVGLTFVGLLSGCRFQVTAPTSSLMLVSAECYQAHGLLGLGIAVVFAGLMQMSLGFFNVGSWFRIIPLSALNGIMSGIGIVVLATQLPKVFGVSDIALVIEQLSIHNFIIGAFTLLLIVTWKKNFLVPKVVRNFVPSFGVGLIFSIAIYAIWNMNVSQHDYSIKFVFPYQNVSLSSLDNDLLLYGLSIAMIASIKTLVTTSKLENLYGEKLNLNRELMVQGVGNCVCGFLGSLPISSHLVRTISMKEVGAQQRTCIVLQGVWTAAVLAVLKDFLYLVPAAGVSAVIAVCGYKLIDFKFLKGLKKYGRGEMAIAYSSMASVVVLDITYGLIVGISIAIFRLLLTFSKDFRIHLNEEERDRFKITIAGSLTFMHLPRMYELRYSIPSYAKIHVDTEKIHYFDRACIAFFAEWQNNLTASKGTLSFNYIEFLDKSRCPTEQREEIMQELRGLDRRGQGRSMYVGRREIDHMIYADLLKSQENECFGVDKPALGRLRK